MTESRIAMRALEKLNVILTAAAVVVIVGIGGYLGVESFLSTRAQFHDDFKKGLQRKINESSKSLPDGLNGKYPADGPLADYYREHPNGIGTLDFRNPAVLPGFPDDSGRD